MTGMRTTCPDCGHHLTWQLAGEGDELDELSDRLRSLEAERRRPVPPRPEDPRRHRRGQK